MINDNVGQPQIHIRKVSIMHRINNYIQIFIKNTKCLQPYGKLSWNYSVHGEVNSSNFCPVHFENIRWMPLVKEPISKKCVIKAMDEGAPQKTVSIRTLNHFAVWNLPIQGLSLGNFQYMLPDPMLLQGPVTTRHFNIAQMGKIGEICIFLCIISHTEKSVHHFGTKN